MANLTPTDIVNKEFHRSLRGYSIDEVDEFLQQASDSLYHALEEHQRQQMQIDELRAELQHFRDTEGLIKNALLLAERTAEEVRAHAAQEGDRLRREMDEQLRTARREVEDLRQLRLRMLTELRAVLGAHLALLESQEERAPVAGGESGHGV